MGGGGFLGLGPLLNQRLPQVRAKLRFVKKRRRMSLQDKLTLRAPSTTPSSLSPTQVVRLSLGHLLVRLALRVHVNQHLSQLSLQLKQQHVVLKSTVSRRLMSLLRDLVQVAKQLSVHYRQQDLKLEPSQMSLQLHTMVAVHPSHVEFKEGRE